MLGNCSVATGEDSRVENVLVLDSLSSTIQPDAKSNTYHAAVMKTSPSLQKTSMYLGVVF